MHQQITFKRCPIIYLKDKIRGIIFNFSTYFPTIISWIITLAGFAGGIWSFYSKELILILFSIVILIFGVINIVQATSLERYKIRLKRAHNSFTLLHECAHRLRDYRSYKAKAERELDAERIYTTLHNICSDLLKHYMNPLHHGKVNLTLKIYHNKKLHPVIRLGENNQNRNKEAEDIDESGFYKLFNEKKEQYMFIHDIDNCSTEELEDFQGYSKKIKDRAHLHRYRTFLALPVNLGDVHTGNEEYDKAFRAYSCLGFIGFDKSEPYSFGNIHDYQIDYLATVVDSLSEIISDYQSILNQRNGRG